MRNKKTKDPLDEIFVDKHSEEELKRTRQYRIKKFGINVVELQDKIEKKEEYILRLKKRIQDLKDYDKGCITKKAHNREIKILQKVADDNFIRGEKNLKKATQQTAQKIRRKIEEYRREEYFYDEARGIFVCEIIDPILKLIDEM